MLGPPPPVRFCSLFNDPPSPPQRTYYLNDPQEHTCVYIQYQNDQGFFTLQYELFTSCNVSNNPSLVSARTGGRGVLKQMWTGLDMGRRGGAKNSQICGTDAESCQHFFQLFPTSQNKFFSLAMFPWMLILTHSFLMQPPTSLSVPSDLKNHFFKRSIFFITKVSVFFYQIFLFITFPITLIFSKILQLYLSILS